MQIGNAATTDLGEFQRPGVGPDGRINVDQISSQEFQPDTASMIGGLSSGAAGLATGNPLMAAAGFGSAAIGAVRSGIARNQFNNERERAIKAARRHNFGVDYREEYMDNLGGSFNDAFNRFY